MKNFEHEFLLACKKADEWARKYYGDRYKEDLTQDAILAALENIGQFNNTCKLSTWVFSILKNKYFNENKRKKPTYIADLTLQEIEGLTEHRPTPVNENIIKKVVMLLTENDKKILQWVATGADYSTVAKKLELKNSDVVKTSVYLLRKKIKHEILFT